MRSRIEVKTGCDKRRVLLEVEERREERRVLLEVEERREENRVNYEECRILFRCPIKISVYPKPDTRCGKRKLDCTIRR
jgi:hypothetical protein